MRASRSTEPQFGIAPGQACVFYQGSRVLGGGWIERERTRHKQRRGKRSWISRN